MDKETTRMIEAAVKRLAASQLSGGARAMERLRALEGRAAQNMMELQNIRTRVKDTFEYYEDGGVAEGDDGDNSQEGEKHSLVARRVAKTSTTSPTSPGSSAAPPNPAILSKRPSFLRARSETDKSKNLEQKHERLTIATMFEDFEKRSPVLAKMLEEVQASTRKAHTVLESLSNALERRQAGNDDVAKHAKDTQVSFGSASSTFNEESGKLNDLSNEVLDLLHAQRDRLKRAVGETAREQDRLAKAFEDELSNVREEATRAAEEAGNLREKLEREYRAKRTREKSAVEVLKAKDSEIKRLQEEIELMLESRRKKQESEEAERLQQEQRNEEMLKEKVGKAIEAQEKLEVLEQAHKNVKQDLANERARTAELEKQVAAALEKTAGAVKRAKEEAESRLVEREEAWQRERDALEREREQREEMEKERIANSQAEGAKELSNAREAIKRLKEALVNANGENKKLQNELKAAAGKAAEAKSAAADAVAKLKVTGPPSARTAEHIRRLEMTIEDLLSREINRDDLIKGLKAEVRSIKAAKDMMISSTVAAIHREDAGQETETGTESDLKQKQQEERKERERPVVNVVQPALKQAEEVRTELRKEFQSAIDTEVRLLSKSVETFKRNQLGKTRDLIKETQKARREGKKANDELRLAKEALEDLRLRHNAARDTVANLKETVAVLDSTLTQKETNNRGLLIEIANLQRALRNANCKGTLTALASSASLKEEFEHRLKESRESAKTLTRVNTAMKSRLVVRDEKISDLAGRVNELGDSLASERDAHAAAEARCAELEARLTLQETQVAAAKNAVAELQRAKIENAYGIAEAQAEADTLREQNLALAKTNGEVQLELLEANTKIAALKEEYESAAAKQQERLREAALAGLRKQVREQQGALDVLSRDEDVQRATVRAEKLARDCKALHVMLAQMSGERIAFYSAVEGGAPFLRALDVTVARLERLKEVVQMNTNSDDEEKTAHLRERAQGEIAALKSELVEPALRFRKAFRKALSRFKKSKRELLSRAHTGHVVMDSLLLCPVCGAGGGSHYLPDRKPVTTDDLGLLPSIRGDGRGKKKQTKTRAKEERRRKRQRRSRSGSRGGSRVALPRELREEQSTRPENEQETAEALRKELQKLVVGSSEEADAALAKSHRKMRNRKAMRELGVKSAALADVELGKGRKKKKKRRIRGGEGIGSRLQGSASLPALSGAKFGGGGYHFDMRG